MKLSYYPGCTLKNQALNFDDSTLFALKHLNVEFEELQRWNCCGTVYSLTSDDMMRQLAPVRNLIRTKEAGNSKMVTSCSMCFNTLKRANQRVRENEADRNRINAFMYDEEVNYEGDVDVLHVLETFRDQVGFKALKAKVTKPLKGLKVACYYGCMLVRPDDVAIDDTENPRVMEDLITALGGTPVDYSHKVECCGAYRTVDMPEVVAHKTYEILGAARSQGADVVVVSCPLCAYNLDHRQELTLKVLPDFRTIPIVYFTQLMALAFGASEEALRLDLHHTPPRPVLASKGLV